MQIYNEYLQRADECNRLAATAADKETAETLRVAAKNFFEMAAARKVYLTFLHSKQATPANHEMISLDSA